MVSPVALAAPVAAGRPVRFERDFIWGVSTSAFQIEGAMNADGRGPSIWDEVALGEPMVDHYYRVAEDVELLRQLGVGAYRFSVAWPRILPDGTGRANPLGLDFYDRLVDRLLAAGIAPYACLYHWDLPVALQQRGGWLNRDIVGHFTDYARLVVERLGDRVKNWIPINEALSIAYGGYAIAYFPPFVKDEKAYFAAAHHLNMAQGSAMKALAAPGRSFGTAMCLYPVRPATPSAGDAAAAQFHAAITTKLFLDPLLLGRYPDAAAPLVAAFVQDGDLETIRQNIDFIGVNYYGPEYRRKAADAPFGTDRVQPAHLVYMKNGVPIDPNGLYEQLLDLRDRYGNPKTYITENGAAFQDRPNGRNLVSDLRRIVFLREHLTAAHRAFAEGVDLRGYFVWSIFDNYEWIDGFNTRFGLVYADTATGRLAPKSSFAWYQKVLASRAL